MSEKDDQDWFDLVAGREVPDADPDVRREAAWVRTALLAQQGDEEVAVVGTPIEDAERTRRLLDRARQEGLIAADADGTRGPRLRPKGSPILSWFFGLRAFVALAAVLLLAVGLVVLMPPSTPVDEEVTNRGGVPQLVIREVSDPAVAAKSFGDALEAAGLETVRRQGAESWYVETTVPTKPSAAAIAAFEKVEIFSLRPGPVRVMFRMGD